MTCYYLKFLVAEWVLELLLFTPHIVSASFNMTVYENLKLRKKVEANKGLTKDSLKVNWATPQCPTFKWVSNNRAKVINYR